MIRIHGFLEISLKDNPFFPCFLHRVSTFFQHFSTCFPRFPTCFPRFPTCFPDVSILCFPHFSNVFPDLPRSLTVFCSIFLDLSRFFPEIFPLPRSQAVHGDALRLMRKHLAEASLQLALRAAAQGIWGVDGLDYGSYRGSISNYSIY